MCVSVCVRVSVCVGAWFCIEVGVHMCVHRLGRCDINKCATLESCWLYLNFSREMFAQREPSYV